MDKFCSLCCQNKPVDQFGKRKLSGDGLQTWCKSCMADKQREWRSNNPDKVAAEREVARVRMAKRYHENDEYRAKSIAKSRKWKNENPDRCYASDRNARLKREYGITQSEYERMVCDQGGNCALCGKLYEGLVVDHDHSTGGVRGLLCYSCNVGLGLLGDSIAGLRSAEDYLSRELIGRIKDIHLTY